MTILSRHRVDNKIEKKILTGLIVSDTICKELVPIIRPMYFQTSYISTIYKWVESYFLSYGKSPGKYLRDIFESEKGKLDQAEVKIIEQFLTNLSDDYEDQSKLNEKYLVDKAVLYIRERSIVIRAGNAKTLAESGRIDQAESEIIGYRKVMKMTSSWIDPFDPKEVNKAMDVTRDVMFSFPGMLGKLSGEFERGFFIGFLGPVKRGKTFWLLELATIGLIHGYRVAVASFEMKDKRVQRRFYKRLSSAVKGGGNYVYPCFDCLSNQDGTCTRRERVNRITLRKGEEEPIFSQSSRYKACTYCRENDPDYYVPATWFSELQRPSFDLKNVRKAIKNFTTTYGRRNFRLKAYPRFSANVSDVKRDLDIMEYTEGFIPDILIFDYADIASPEDSRAIGRDRIDETWKTLAGLADERNCLVITASQSTRASWGKKNVTAEDTAEDYRKIAHVDMMFSLNQTFEEKKKGIMRIAKVAGREEDFNELNQVTVLQQLGAGQPFLDSEFF